MNTPTASTRLFFVSSSAATSPSAKDIQPIIHALREILHGVLFDAVLTFPKFFEITHALCLVLGNLGDIVQMDELERPEIANDMWVKMTADRLTRNISAILQTAQPKLNRNVLIVTTGAGIPSLVAQLMKMTPGQNSDNCKAFLDTASLTSTDGIMLEVQNLGQSLQYSVAYLKPKLAEAA